MQAQQKTLLRHNKPSPASYHHQLFAALMLPARCVSMLEFTKQQPFARARLLRSEVLPSVKSSVAQDRLRT
jgi:hypothetical protein